MTWFKRCQHLWTEVFRNFAPAYADVDKMYGRQTAAMIHTARVASEGQTIIELRCDHCGDINVKRFYGKVGA